MDTITHALIGTVIAETGFRRKLGRKALIAGTILASLPDADIIFALSSDHSAMLKYHRAASHSIILAFIAAPILGWLTWKLSKKTGSILSWSILALLALISHDILDLCTTWGTEVLYPFSNKRYSLDALPIIDPLITIPLLLFLCSTLLLKNLYIRKKIALVILSWCILYSCAGLVQSNKALKLASAAKPADFNIVQSKAIPNIGTILLWHVVLKDNAGNFFTTSVSSLSGKVFNERYFESLSSEKITNALNSDKFEIFRRASSDLLLAARLPRNDEVSFIDMRYAMLDKTGSSIPIFFFNVFLDQDTKEVIRVERQLPDRTKSGNLSIYLNAIFN